MLVGRPDNHRGTRHGWRSESTVCRVAPRSPACSGSFRREVLTSGDGVCRYARMAAPELAGKRPGAHVELPSLRSSSECWNFCSPRSA